MFSALPPVSERKKQTFLCNAVLYNFEAMNYDGFQNIQPVFGTQ